MRTLCALVSLIVTTSVFAADKPAAPLVSTFYEKPYDITASVRTNGCKLELRRYPEAYTKTKPRLQGFWVQDVFVGEKLILEIRHSAADNEQSLAIERDKDYGVLQFDRDLDGKYETVIVASLRDQGLKDVLFVTADGSLRHSTPVEFQAWQSRSRENKQAIDAADKAIRKAMEKANEDLKK